MKYQRGCKWKLLAKSYQSWRVSCLSFAVPRVRYALSESRPLGVERKMGGKVYLEPNIGLRPTAKKYCDGKIQKDFGKRVNSA